MRPGHKPRKNTLLHFYAVAGDEIASMRPGHKPRKNADTVAAGLLDRLRFNEAGA